MKAVTLTCDRCGVLSFTPWKTCIVEEFIPKAIRSGFHPDAPPGWRELADDEAIEDVCPNCLTVVERAEEIVRQSEDVPF